MFTAVSLTVSFEPMYSTFTGCSTLAAESFKSCFSTDEYFKCDVALCASSENRCFGQTCHLHLQGIKIRERGKALAVG
jgi:hypothetical protein